MYYYNIALPPDNQLAAASVDNVEKGMRVVGKLDAGYWSGLINYQRANDHAADRRNNYKAAVTWFDKQTLHDFPNSPWTNGAQYNLARTLEALGDTEQATLQYESNDDASPGYHGDLLRAKWLKGSARIASASSDFRRHSERSEQSAPPAAGRRQPTACERRRP